MTRYEERKPTKPDFYVRVFGKNLQQEFKQIAIKKEIQDISVNGVFLHLFLFKDDYGWNISEAQTGLKVAAGKTQKEAIEAAKNTVKKYEKNFTEEIFKNIESYDLSPRYQ